MEIGIFFFLALAFGTAFATGASDAHSTPCSKICGGGYRIRVPHCPNQDVDKCEKIYEECNTFACPPRKSCPYNHSFRYRSRSSCCKKSTESCGVPREINVRRIFGGYHSRYGEWPWVAAIVKKSSKTAHCGGSLIHKDYVLTAAHCIAEYNIKDYYILLGSNTIRYPKLTKQVIDIAHFIPYPEYQDPIHDVGLIKLKKSAMFNNYVKPICLPNGEEVHVDMTCVVAGWGIVRPEDLNSGVKSNYLEHVSIRNLPSGACKNGLQGVSWRIANYSDVENLCFGILSGDKDVCKSDSGGSVMCQRCSSCSWYVAGIALYGPQKCESKGLPSVFTYVKYYEDWIKNGVKGLSSKSVSC